MCISLVKLCLTLQACLPTGSVAPSLVLDVDRGVEAKSLWYKKSWASRPGQLKVSVPLGFKKHLVSPQRKHVPNIFAAKLVVKLKVFLHTNR